MEKYEKYELSTGTVTGNETMTTIDQPEQQQPADDEYKRRVL